MKLVDDFLPQPLLLGRIQYGQVAFPVALEFIRVQDLCEFFPTFRVNGFESEAGIELGLLGLCPWLLTSNRRDRGQERQQQDEKQSRLAHLGILA